MTSPLPPLPSLLLLSYNVIEYCLGNIGCVRATGLYQLVSSGVSEQVSHRDWNAFGSARYKSYEYRS